MVYDNGLLAKVRKPPSPRATFPQVKSIGAEPVVGRDGKVAYSIFSLSFSLSLPFCHLEEIMPRTAGFSHLD